MKVAVLYSGGADSTLLLHIALENHDIEDVTVLYGDFKCEKTNPSRMENLKHVLEYTENLGVTCLVETITPDSIGKGPEGNARAAFKKLRDWAEREFEIVYIGHNLDDHIETVMIQLFRGAGYGTRGIPDYHHGKVYRPLIAMTRDEVREKCDKLKLKFFDDPSNSDTSMTRSFWRNEILPKLKEHYGVGIYKRINTIAEKVSNA